MSGPDPSKSGTGGRSIDGARKRKDPPKDSNKNVTASGNSRFHKRAKVFDARSVRTQPSDAALNHGELDLQAFLNAREFEIRAMTDGMRKSKAVNNRRAFQLVPRAMRRRTASHNVKKLPKRLRPRARREQVDDKTPTVEARRRKPKTTRARIRLEAARRLGVVAEKRRKRRLRDAKEKAKDLGEDAADGKKGEVSAAIKQLIDTRPARPKIRRNMLNDPLKPKAKFRKRQIDKTWLPTHMWHAKRATMTPPTEPLWRFAIPLTPTEKVYRPTHRASTVKGALVWDMSYMSTIALCGHAPGIERTLRSLGMSHASLWDDRGKTWREGRRQWSGVLSKQHGDARRHIGPATILWNPGQTPPRTSEGTATRTEQADRQVYIRVHPACFLELFEILVKLIKRETPRLYVEDLRFEIGSIEVTGPGAVEALLGTIRPYHQKEDTREAHAELFRSLTTTATAAALPPDAVLGFSTQDPRLCYPPQTVREPTPANNPSAETGSLTNTAPAPFLLFDRDARFRASHYPSQKALNRRKGTVAPGKSLQVTKADPPFPLIIFSSRTKASAQTTWTVLTPWKCILPLWYSIVHYPLSTGGNPRVSGLNELRQISFERGQSWFPGDFPGTDAGAEWELEQRQKRKANWEKRPKSKRVAWESLDLGAGRKGEIGLGWACEYERLFGLQQVAEAEPKPQTEQSSTRNSVNDAKRAEKPQGNKFQAAIVEDDEGGGASLHEQAADVEKANSRKKASRETPPHPLTLVHHLSRPSFNALVSSKTADAPPSYAVVAVKIVFPGRGVVEPCARIYRLPQPRAASTILPCTQPEVPATHPPSRLSAIPADRRNQWLAKIPGSTAYRSQQPSSKQINQPTRFTSNADHDTQRLMFAHSLMMKKVPFPPEKDDSGGGDQPLLPGEEDLIGYVTKGKFNLAEGNGVAIGSVSVEKVLSALRFGGEREGRVCVVRNAGATVGWAGRWEAV